MKYYEDRGASSKPEEEAGPYSGQSSREERDRWDGWKDWTRKFWEKAAPKINVEERNKRMMEAKAKRFTLSARLLGGKATTVSVINQPEVMPAVYDTEKDKLYLNEAHPNTSDEVAALVYDRGKLFHELGHCRWTQKECKRAELAEELVAKHGEKTRQQFMTMSNILEDGRIERLLRQKWAGSGKYLDTLLGACSEGNNPIANSPWGSLPLYVRKGVFRNEEDEKFWQPYIAEIEQARRSITTRNVCKIAASLVERLKDLLPEPPPLQPPPQGEGEGEGKDGDKKDGEKSKADRDKGKDEGARDKAQEIAEAGMEACRPEAKELHEELEQEITEQKAKVQEYADAEEEQEAEQLAEIFRSILTELNRKRSNQSREGKLNPHALTKALTNRRCFATIEDSLGVPYVALLLDRSGSMSSELRSATRSARIVNGALFKSGIESKFILFGSEVEQMDFVPVDGVGTQGSTATGQAMELANNWFETKEAARALMVVITDGGPNDAPTCIREKARCQEANGHVLGIVYADGGMTKAYLDTLFTTHAEFNQRGNQNLADLLEPYLAQFLIGGGNE